MAVSGEQWGPAVWNLGYSIWDQASQVMPLPGHVVELGAVVLLPLDRPPGLERDLRMGISVRCEPEASVCWSVSRAGCAEGGSWLGRCLSGIV